MKQPYMTLEYLLNQSGFIGLLDIKSSTVVKFNKRMERRLRNDFYISKKYIGSHVISSPILNRRNSRAYLQIMRNRDKTLDGEMFRRGVITCPFDALDIFHAVLKRKGDRMIVPVRPIRAVGSIVFSK